MAFSGVDRDIHLAFDSALDASDFGRGDVVASNVA